MCLNVISHRPKRQQRILKQPGRYNLLKSKDAVFGDKVIMSPLSEYAAKMAAPPLPETAAHALISLPSPFYKSHLSPASLVVRAYH
jgi:hypothetical protein